MGRGDKKIIFFWLAVFAVFIGIFEISEVSAALIYMEDSIGSETYDDVGVSISGNWCKLPDGSLYSKNHQSITAQLSWINSDSRCKNSVQAVVDGTKVGSIMYISIGDYPATRKSTFNVEYGDILQLMLYTDKTSCPECTCTSGLHTEVGRSKIEYTEDCPPQTDCSNQDDCNDNNPCTTDTCSEGECYYTNVLDYTTADGCSSSETMCKTKVCVSGECTEVNLAKYQLHNKCGGGGDSGRQNECKHNACDGEGNCIPFRRGITNSSGHKPFGNWPEGYKVFSNPYSNCSMFDSHTSPLFWEAPSRSMALNDQSSATCCSRPKCPSESYIFGDTKITYSCSANTDSCIRFMNLGEGGCSANTACCYQTFYNSPSGSSPPNWLLFGAGGGGGGDQGTHSICTNDQCISVPGSGTSTCSKDSDCSGGGHFACSSGQCLYTSGEGNDLCMTDDQCSSSGHYSCNSSGKCIYTSEAGVNSCLNDFDCIFQKAGLYAACSETSCILARGTGQNFCQSNADCGGGCGNTICEIGEQISCPQDCSGQLCVLTSAKWEKNTAFEGEVIDLYVNGTNCEGLIINFTIKKNGILFDDPVLTSPLNAVFANGQAKTSWVAELNGSESAEYYFIAALISNPDKKIESQQGKLVVQRVDESRPYWANLDGNRIYDAELFQRIRLIYNGSGLTGKTFSFKIYNSTSAEIWEKANTSSSDNTAFIEWDAGNTTQDFKSGNYIFEVFESGASLGRSVLLSVLNPDGQRPTEIKFISPNCGDYIFLGNSIDINVSLKNPYAIPSGFIDFGDGQKENIAGNNIFNFSHEYATPGTKKIIVQANTSSGITTAKTINIIIINSSSNENYIAACIAAPENLQQINESMVLFNASTTRAINYTTSSGIKNISLDMLKFNWTFSDGINCLFLGNSYDCELSDKRKADTDSSSVSGYLFKKRFLNSGRNWAKLVISF